MGFALLLGLALNLPPMFLGLRVTGMRGTFPLVHLGAVVLLVAFTTATIVFTYGLVGRFVDRNRFGSVAACRRPACRRPSWVSRRSSRTCWSSPAFASIGPTPSSTRRPGSRRST